MGLALNRKYRKTQKRDGDLTTKEVRYRSLFFFFNQFNSKTAIHRELKSDCTIVPLFTEISEVLYKHIVNDVGFITAALHLSCTHYP